MPIEKSLIFLMFPRLFKVYYPNYYTVSKKLKRISVEGSDITEEEKEEIPGKESVSDNLTDSLEDEEGLLTTTAYGALWRNKKLIKIFDCFMFLMMYRTATLERIPPVYNEEEEIQEANQTSPKKTPSGKLRKYFSAVKNNLRSQTQLHYIFQRIAEFVSNEKRLLLENLRDIYKVSLSVESQLFSYSLGIKEVAIVSTVQTKPKVHRFFRQFAELQENYLLEILMISPENMNTICKIS
jgi:hypothetical protein